MTPTTSLIEAPEKPALKVELLKKHLRIDNDYEDDILEIMIHGATERIEEYIDMKIIKQKWAILWDSFTTLKSNEPWWDGTREMAIGELYQCNTIIKLPFGKVMGDDYSFSTIDETGDYVAFDQDNYKIDAFSKQARLALVGGNQWPSTVAPLNGIKFEAYFGVTDDQDKVPNAIKQALLIFCSELYENKGDDNAEITIPQTALTLLAPYRSIKV